MCAEENITAPELSFAGLIRRCMVRNRVHAIAMVAPAKYEISRIPIEIALVVTRNPRGPTFLFRGRAKPHSVFMLEAMQITNVHPAVCILSRKSLCVIWIIITYAEIIIDIYY